MLGTNMLCMLVVNDIEYGICWGLTFVAKYAFLLSTTRVTGIVDGSCWSLFMGNREMSTPNIQSFKWCNFLCCFFRLECSQEHWTDLEHICIRGRHHQAIVWFIVSLISVKYWGTRAGLFSVLKHLLSVIEKLFFECRPLPPGIKEWNSTGPCALHTLHVVWQKVNGCSRM